jgi:hypothetical protein
MRSRVSCSRTVVLVAAFGLLAFAAGSAHASIAAPAGAVPKCQHPTRHDAHNRWEVVFGLEPTLAKAQKLQALAIARGFSKAGVEVECMGYSVANAGFKSRATALVVLQRAKTAGFTKAFTEDS